MKRGLVFNSLAFLLWLGTVAPAATDHFAFASVEEGQASLTVRDDFVMRLSPFDRAARLKQGRDVSEKEYLEFVRRNVLPWTEDDKKRVSVTLQRIEQRFQELDLELPDKVVFVKTTGDEEGGAAYTRGNIIVFPQNILADQNENLMRLISHELFHICSRRDVQLRDRLYEIIGFKPCAEFEFPRDLASRRVTNPDAPKNDHRIRVTYRGHPYWTIPILYANSARYDSARGGKFFDYMTFKLALIEKAGVSPNGIAENSPPLPHLVDVNEVEGFFEQIGRNTGYIIHPEEILADNFALIVMGRTKLPAPEIPKAVLRALQGRKAAKTP